MIVLFLFLFPGEFGTDDLVKTFSVYRMDAIHNWGFGTIPLKTI